MDVCPDFSFLKTGESYNIQDHLLSVSGEAKKLQFSHWATTGFISKTANLLAKMVQNPHLKNQVVIASVFN